MVTIIEATIAIWALATFVYCWLYVIPSVRAEMRDYKNDAPIEILRTFQDALSGKDKELEAVMDELFTMMTAKILKNLTKEEKVQKFIKEYMNGMASTFVKMICGRFGINESEMQKMVKQAGGAVNEDGSVDFMGVLMRKLPGIIDKGIDNFME